MERIVDTRGLACPLPALKARLALRDTAPGDVLVVLATDPEAPIDVAAVAADADCTFSSTRVEAAWELRLVRR